MFLSVLQTANYVHSGFIYLAGQNRLVAIDGDLTSFYLQSSHRVKSANNKLTNEDARGNVQSPEEQLMVNILADGCVSGEVIYLDCGKY